MGLPLGMGRSGQRQNKRYDKQIFQGSLLPARSPPSRGETRLIARKNTGLAGRFQVNLELREKRRGPETPGRLPKKTPLGTVWDVPAEAKRPCNYPLSTDRCDYQASEEESPSKKPVACAGFTAEHPALHAMQVMPPALRETYAAESFCA